MTNQTFPKTFNNIEEVYKHVLDLRKRVESVIILKDSKEEAVQLLQKKLIDYVRFLRKVVGGENITHVKELAEEARKRDFSTTLESDKADDAFKEINFMIKSCELLDEYEKHLN